MMYSLSLLSLVLVALNAQTTTKRPGGNPNPDPITTKRTGTTVADAPADPVTMSGLPPAKPEPPVTPPANSGNTHITIATTASPGNSNPNPGTTQQQQPPVVPPVVPQQPPATPQFGPYMAGMMDPKELKCEFGQCMNRKITLTPPQGFKLECNMAFQCNGLDLTLNIGADPLDFGNHVNEINDLNFDAPQNGVTITMNNMFPGNFIEVNNINCKVFGACQNMKILAGFGVELWELNVKCEVPGACTGCTINGQSCQMISIMTGNNGGYMPYGFGYMNQPNIPQQPGSKAPGSATPPQTAPQYPQYYPAMYPGWI